MRHLVLAPLLCVTACVVPAAPQVERARDCAAATFADNPLLTAAFTARFDGRYWNSNEHVVVWREGQRLYVRRSGHTRVQLRPASQMQGAGAFRDGCGTTYDFILPPDGPGGYVIITQPNGARSEWHRRL